MTFIFYNMWTLTIFSAIYTELRKIFLIILLEALHNLNEILQDTTWYMKFFLSKEGGGQAF